ncbi:hypothetical protein LCGC14_1370190 [marine sediment metagenome]|uniref:thymidylate synthase n=1 Tax=marine sediment metagenome TaxID=412755 RepID=A0A0F9MKT7_9ZZZZ
MKEIKNYPEIQYLNALKKILISGEKVCNRTGVDSLRIRSVSMRYDLSKSFPLLTTKRIWFKGVVTELIWMLRGDTNIKFLVDNDVNIWNDDAWRWHKKTNNYRDTKFDTQKDFIEFIKNEDPYKYIPSVGDLGPCYGKQWRCWQGVSNHIPSTPIPKEPIDQIKKVISGIKSDPYSRRNMITAWNPAEIDDVALPACHYSCIFSVSEKKLNCGVTLRSNDAFLGSPFNIAQYALLNHFIALWTDLDVGDLDYWAYDFHLYENHIDAAREQIKRKPRLLPYLKIRKAFTLEDLEKITDVRVFINEHLNLMDYNPYPTIKAPLSVGLKNQ